MVPLTPERARDWRARVGYAPDAFVFHNSIRANLRWSNPDAGEAEIRSALRMADADEFVTALQNSLDTVVGDRGVAFSQGERQRLALAYCAIRSCWCSTKQPTTSILLPKAACLAHLTACAARP